MEQISHAKCFGGDQTTWRHESRETGTSMRFSVFLPPQAESERRPVLWWLSGLTCTEENFTVKSGAQRIAAELGLILIAPDTSPRGADTPDDPAYDLGQGAGFYVDAVQPPWADRFRMYSYLTGELPALAQAHLPMDPTRQSISGHSMGGHGALILALKNPGRFRSVSAFAPIVAPSATPWGRKAFTAYLGPDERSWRAWDAVALIEDGARAGELLIDQGQDDPFLDSELQPERLTRACAAAGAPIELRRRPGYDHSYFFIATYLNEHLAWHAERLA
jgi:S-formylglutathione hydrolase